MSDQEVYLEYMALSELKEADLNPKDHDLGELYTNIQRHGFVEIPVIDERSGKLVAGHGRIETLKMLKKDGIEVKNIKIDENGEWLVPIQRGISFSSESEAQAYLISSNRLVELGGWKEDELLDLLEQVATDTNDLSGVGFNLDDMQGILDNMETKIFEDEYLDEVDDEKIIRFKLGRYRFGIDADHFYAWEEEKVKELGSNSPTVIVDWIKDQLGLRG